MGDRIALAPVVVRPVALEDLPGPAPEEQRIRALEPRGQEAARSPRRRARPSIRRARTRRAGPRRGLRDPGTRRPRSASSMRSASWSSLLRVAVVDRLDSTDRKLERATRSRRWSGSGQDLRQTAFDGILDPREHVPMHRPLAGFLALSVAAVLVAGVAPGCGGQAKATAHRHAHADRPTDPADADPPTDPTPPYIDTGAHVDTDPDTGTRLRRRHRRELPPGDDRLAAGRDRGQAIRVRSCDRGHADRGHGVLGEPLGGAGRRSRGRVVPLRQPGYRLQRRWQ